MRRDNTVKRSFLTVAKASLVLVPLLAALLGLVKPATLTAQASAASSEHRDFCNRLVTRLQRVNSASYQSALRNLRSCSAQFALPILLREWETPPIDATAVRSLAKTTSEFRDRRLLDALRRVAADKSLPRTTRIATFHTLASYFDPHTVLLFRQLDKPGLSGPRYVLIGALDHPVWENGPLPLRVEVQSEILTLLTSLEADPDPVVRAVARYLAEQLRFQRTT